MPVSTTHRFNERPASRRQGQALIIAVLVMLLAALLSSAFLVLVANQGHVVGRAYERDLARSTAQQGFDQVSALLKASPNSDDWQAEAEPSLIGLRTNATAIDAGDLPPGLGEADYDFYWSPLDKAQGWALNYKYTSPATDLAGRLAELATFKRQGGRVFVKVPNPLLNRRQVPAYMVESRLLDQAGDEVSDGGDKKFMMRVTVIGLSPRGDSSWARQTFYKPTNYNGAAFSYAQFVSNYSVDSKTFLTAPAVASTVTAGATQVQLNVDSTKFSSNDFALGRQLLISDSQGNTNSVSALSYNPTTQVLIFAPAITAPLNPTSTIVSAAGNMMTSPFSLDPDGVAGNSSQATGPDKLATAVADPLTTPNTDASGFGNGYCFNLGLTLRGQGTIGLRPPYARNQGGFTTYSGQNALVVTGPINSTQTTTSSDAAAGPSQLKVVNTALGGAAPVAIPTAAPADNRYLSVSFDAQGNPRRDTYLSQTDPLLIPRSVVPPNIDFDARYAKLAQGSNPVLGPLGYGDGVYIGNTEDVESFNGTPLTSGQVQRLWQRKSFAVAAAGNVTPVTTPLTAGTTGARLCYARPGVDSYVYPMSGGGLEAQGLRGWTSPWEYLPRGTQVILDGANNKITIIRDPLSDTGALAANKAWKNLNGTDIPGRPFKMELDLTAGTRTVGGGSTVAFSQPAAFNGIIAAEGNIRVRGDWSASNRPLTIVSKNNIYIEGSTTGKPGKLALLAKKNVVVNPTQFVVRPEGLVDRSIGQTPDTGTAATTSTITVVAPTRYALGQLITIGDDNQMRSITDITGAVLTFAPAATALTDFDRQSTGTPASSFPVRQVCDPGVVQIHPVTDTTVTPNVTSLVEVKSTDPLPVAGGRWAYAWKRRGDTLLRQFPANMPTPRLNVEQGVQRIDVAFRAKRASSTYTLATRATNKRIQGTITPAATPDPTPNPTPIENFDTDMRDLSPIMGPTPAPTADGDVNATLGTLKTRLETSPTPSANPPYDPNWEVAYPTPTPLPAGAATPVPGTPDPYTTVPVRRLSATSATITTPATPTAADAVTVPLLPSIGLSFDQASNTNPVMSLLNTIGSWFGFVSSPVTPAVDDKEIPFTVNSTFISNTMKWNSVADTNYNTGTDYNLGGTAGGTFALQRDATDRQDLLPAYYVSGWHWENPTNIYDAATPVNIQATIYAESGSWFVIPQPGMTAQDTTVSDTDKARLYRPFTQIIVNSSIAQGYSPTADLDYDLEPDPEGRQFGATKTWLDALARQNSATTYDVIQYGALPLPANLAPGDRVNLPTSGDILYTYVS